MMNLKFSQKFTFGAILLTVLGVLISSVTIYNVSEDYIEDLVIDLMAERNKTTLEELERFVNTKLSDVEVLAEIPAIANWPNNPKQAAEMLVKIRNTYRVYESISIISEANIAKINTNRLNLDEKSDYSSLIDEVKLVRKSNFSFKISGDGYKGNLIAAGPIGQNNGYLVFEIPMTRIKDYLATFDHPIGGHIKPKFNIKDLKGTPLLTNFNSPSLYENTNHKHNHNFKIKYDADHLYIINQIQLEKANSEKGWILETQINKEELDGPIHEARNNLFFLVIFLLVISTFALYKWISHQLSPLHRLFSAMEHYGSKESTPIHSVGSDSQEFVSLINVYNSMIDRLEKSSLEISNASKFAALGEMASGIAHEINNPLQIIRGCNERIPRLLIAGEREKIVEMTKKVTLTTERISKIVAALRTYSRAEKNAQLEEEYLRKVIDDTLTFCEEKFRLADIQILIEIEPRDLVINCKPIQLSQVFINLLNNAHDAILLEPEKWIKIEAKIEENEIAISISNSGPKITSEVAKKLFNPFFTTKEIGKGTGLGLSISKNIIESQKGSISIDIQQEHTSFLIKFPKVQTEILDNVA